MKNVVILLLFVLLLLIQSLSAEGNRVGGTVRIGDKHIEIILANRTSNAIFIKDFRQSFSKGKFIRASSGNDFRSVSNLIHHDVFSTGRHWIYLLAKGTDDYANVKSWVRMELSSSEVLAKSLLSAKNGDYIEIDIYTAKADKVPAPQDWKKNKIILQIQRLK